MYLHEKMQDMQDHWYPMAGVLLGESYRTPKLGRFGYITVQAKEGKPQLLVPGETIRGHEFHYFDSGVSASLLLVKSKVCRPFFR